MAGPNPIRETTDEEHDQGGRLRGAVPRGLGGVAKLPPPPPAGREGQGAAEEKKAKEDMAKEKAKAEQVAAEEATVKNYQANMKKAGKPIPKPTPIVAAAAPAATADAGPGAAKGTPTPGGQASGGAVNAQGQRRGR